MNSPSDTPNPFKSKYDGECAGCGSFKAGDLIVKLPVPAKFERMMSDQAVRMGRPQYRIVRYAHFRCYERSNDRMMIRLWKSKQIPGDPPPDVQRAFDREGARLLQEESQ
jgi:hypothetical protein